MKLDPENKSVKLWQILDHIDTLSDLIKPTTLEGYELYFKAVNKQLDKRHGILESDGYDLYLPGTLPKGERSE